MKTAEAAAVQLGAPVGSIFKSLVLKADTGEVLVAVLPGDKRVDLKAIRRLVGCKQLSFASAQLVLEATGYPAGGTPPLGYPQPLRVIVDEALLQYSEGYGGGGRPELLLQIRPQELVRASRATVARVSL
ncbi:MAG: YbaK/EbsC family protein [Myxococcaceae bacterium]|nr:YbaK/EbsC family protein [Myxococcaceae bacterium]